MLEGRDWATESESSSNMSTPEDMKSDLSMMSEEDYSPTPPPPPPRPQSKIHSSRSKRTAKKTLVTQVQALQW